MVIAKRVNKPWIKEWALGIAIILSLAITYAATRL